MAEPRAETTRWPDGSEHGLLQTGPQLPTWPVDLLLFGFPAIWLLGLAPFAPILLAGCMLVLLVHHRQPLLVVPGIGPWFAFVAWVLVAGLAIDSPLRAVGYTLRAAQIVAIGVTMLYAVNTPRLTPRRLVAGLLTVWFLVVIGGYLGMLLPDVRLPTLTAAVMPGSLIGNEYVRDLVNPPFAEVQQPWGANEPFNRPSAPFPYANSWGSAVIVLVPVAIASLRILDSRRWRVAVVVSLVAALAPATATLNRGMLLALAVGVAYVVARLALRGNVAALAGATVGGAATIAALWLLGVVERITARQAVSDTTTGRAGIYRETFERTLDSPLLGYGAPRPSLTGSISIGTQGHVWNVMFSYGFVGLGLFLLFLWGTTLRTVRAPGTSSLWLHATLVSASLAVFFYGLDTMQMLTVVVCMTILGRQIHLGEPVEARDGAPG